MKKEEILARSRSENKNRDIYEQEVLKQGGGVAIFVAMILASIFVIAQMVLGGGFNYGLYAIVFAFPTTAFWVKWFRIKQRHELIMAVCYTVIVIVFSVYHIYNLIAASTIL